MIRRSACGGLLLALWACSAVARGADPESQSSEPLAERFSRDLPGAPPKQPVGLDASRSRPAASTTVTAEQIRGWVRDLDSEKFAVREASTDELFKAGRAAIPALAAAVNSKSPEVNMRAMRILEELYEGTDTAARAAAQKTLATIAANPTSQGAKRANEILSPPNIVPPPDMMFGGGGGGGRRRRMGGGGFGRAANIPNIQTMVVNGHKKMDVDSGGRRIHFEEEPQGAITIWITEIENGREQTRSFAAKNLDDLNKTQPAEARQLYEQYMAGWAGPFQFRSGAVILRPQAP